MNILFAGTPDFAAAHLTGLVERGITISTVITQPDRAGKRGKKLVSSPVKQLAESLAIPVLQPEKITAADLSSLKPDLLIVVAYGQILKQDLLDLPTHGCINVHGSILPRWRGAAPIQRAVEAGDSTTGVCIMQMDAGLDTGPVLWQKQIDILATDTSGDLSINLARCGIEGLVETIEQIQTHNLNPQVQPVDGTYAKKIMKAEAKIDWKLPATNIVRKVHAFNPDPVCYCECPKDEDSIRMKVYRAETKDITGGSGEILNVSPEGVLVGADSGSVLIKQLQLPLGKGSILTGRDVMNARSDLLHPGVRLT